MTDLASLDALIEAVTAGDLPDEDWRLMHDIWSPRNWHDIGHSVRYSMHGSLDAAKALHEALLPGWIFLIGSQVAGVSAPDHEDPRWWNNIHNGNPARAWLLAILKAYRAGL